MIGLIELLAPADAILTKYRIPLEIGITSDEGIEIIATGIIGGILGLAIDKIASRNHNVANDKVLPFTSTIFGIVLGITGGLYRAMKT